MFDAEIRTLRYVQKIPAAIPPAMVPGAAMLPAYAERAQKLSPSAQEAAEREAQLDLHIREMEREHMRSQQRAHQALEQVQEQAAHALAAALQEQQQRLDLQWSAQVTALSESFASAQDTYFRDVEVQVVRLALDVARRVLHREAQIDPLLLRGPVRVALEELQQHATCVLMVPEETAEAWRRWLAGGEAPAATVEVRAIEGVAADHCRLQVESSTADLSTSSQLAEIERGFFDLLQHRPAAAAESRP